jgi:RNA polymerase sigma-70 factor, ECF subfamily
MIWRLTLQNKRGHRREQGLNAASDEELLRNCRDGSHAAFEELVRRTARFLYAHVYVQTGQPELTQDLVQETYLRAWREIAQVKQAEAFRGWLAKIADRAVIDHRRKAGRKKRFGLTGSLEENDAVAPAASPEAERREDREQALAGLRQLPEAYRVPLMLRYLHGADYDEISRQLGLSNGSLRGLLHRGLAMLRQTMGVKQGNDNEK